MFHYVLEKVGNVPKDSLGPEMKVNTGKELCAAFIERCLYAIVQHGLHT